MLGTAPSFPRPPLLGSHVGVSATPWLCALMRWAGRGPRNPMLTTWTESGIVSGRVALLPRSVEVRPGFFTFPPRTVRTEAAYAFPQFLRPSPARPPPGARGPGARPPPHRPPLGAAPRTRLRKFPRSFCGRHYRHRARAASPPPHARATPPGHRAPGPEGTPAGGAGPRSETPSAPPSARGRTAYTT